MFQVDGVAAAIKLFRFGEDVMQPGARYVPDATRLELWFALSGAATVSFDDRIMRIEAGQGVVIQTSEPYIYDVVGTGPHMLTWCESEPLSAVALPGVTPTLFSINPTMTMLVDLGLAAERRPIAIRDPLALHLGHALLVEVLSRLDERPEARRRRATTDRLRALLAADPRRDWSVAAMARAIGLSTRALNRRLAQEAAPASNELLWRVRVRLGAELLVRSKASSFEIADQCGFQNAPHFSRRIKQITGMTPLAVRQWALSASLAERADFFQAIESAAR